MTEIDKKIKRLRERHANEEIEEIINYASNLATTSDLAAYNEKQQLQFLLFPEGIFYNRKKDQCRTSRVNEVFLDIAQQAGNLPENKKRG